MARPNGPDKDDVLPAGYTEHKVPKEFVTTMFSGTQRAVDWMSCFDCDKDWQGLNDHFQATPAMSEYHENLGEWKGVLGTGGVPADMVPQIFEVYSKKGGFMHLFVINLKYLKEQGGTVDTAGDFLVMSGLDHIAAYR